MSEKPRGSVEYDYADDLELRKRILVRKIKFLMEHDADVQSERANFNSILDALQSDVALMTEGTIGGIETTIETLLPIFDVPEGEFERISAQCFEEYRRELEARGNASSEAEAKAVQPRKTRRRFHWLFGGWSGKKIC
jgi:hypothetical protein